MKRKVLRMPSELSTTLAQRARQRRELSRQPDEGLPHQQPGVEPPLLPVVELPLQQVVGLPRQLQEVGLLHQQVEHRLARLVEQRALRLPRARQRLVEHHQRRLAGELEPNLEWCRQQLEVLCLEVLPEALLEAALLRVVLRHWPSRR
jgi:hypothetical protein